MSRNCHLRWPTPTGKSRAAATCTGYAVFGQSPGTFHAFGHQGYRRLWLSNLVSSMSQMMQMTLLVWFVLERTDSPFLVAGITPQGHAGVAVSDSAAIRSRLTESHRFPTSISPAANLPPETGLLWALPWAIRHHPHPSILASHQPDSTLLAPAQPLYRYPSHC